MRWTFVVFACFLALCSGRPQDECAAEGYCEQTLPPDHDITSTSTSTSAPETTTVDEEDIDGEDDGESHAVTADGLARQAQGSIRAPVPFPRPIPGPIPGPFPGPFPRRERVAFSVRKAITLRAPTRVEFRDVLTNVGGGWIHRRAQFEAPYGGGYYFSFHAVAERGREFTLALMKNGVYQVTAYGTQGDYQHGSNSAFLQLSRGQTVHLQLQEGTIYEHPRREAYTTFTGFMVYRN